MENNAIDHEKKKLADSIIHISSEDQFKLLTELLPLMYQRQQFCQQAQRVKTPENINYITDQLKFYNNKIKELLLL